LAALTSLEPQALPILAIEAVNPLVIDHPALSTQQDVDSEIASDAVRSCGHSKLTEKTIADYERGATRPHARTLSKMEEAFKTAGIEFLNSDAPSGRLRRPSKAERTK
jgi:hypothetical protein